MTVSATAGRGVPLRLHGLAKRFGAVEALRPLDLQIHSGELVAFLGPSGCGKTTTLLLIAGIYKANQGEIYFGERRVDALHPRERDVGMVFQSYALYPHLTLFENIAFPLRLKRVPGKEVKQRVEQVAELLGIAEQLQRRPSQVSGGQQQRAAIARAQVKEPGILLLDEPLSNLDAQIRLQARGEIRRLQKELGVTSILVTHDQAEALAMADRVAVFRDGQLCQYAPPEELYARPADLFVARFVGHPPMNIFAGKVDKGMFQADGLAVKVPADWPSGPGHLGIRPEDLVLVGDNGLSGGSLSGTGSGSGSGTGTGSEGVPGGDAAVGGKAVPQVGSQVGAELLIAESQGREFLLTARASGSTFQALTPRRPESEDRVRLRFPLEHLHLFDPEGKRLRP